MRGKAQRVAHPAQLRLQTKVPNFLNRCTVIIGSVNVRIHVAILPSSVDAANRVNVGYANFRRFAPKIGYHCNFPLPITKRRLD